MQAEIRRAIEWDCTGVLLRFYRCLDESRYDELADLFAPDGVWHRFGKRRTGREDILRALHERPAAQTTRHIVTNVLVDAREHEASATLCVTAYRHEGEASGARHPGAARIPGDCTP